MWLVDLARRTRAAVVAGGRTELLVQEGARVVPTILLHGHAADLARCNPDLVRLGLDRYAILLAPGVRVTGAYLFAGGRGAILEVGQHMFSLPDVRPARFRADAAAAGLRVRDL